MDGSDNIVNKDVLDTVSTTLHVTKRLVCAKEAVTLDGVVINVMNVMYISVGRYVKYRFGNTHAQKIL